MILPSTYALTLAVLVLSMICWGSWANTLKASKWRFELFYIDFSIGTVIAAVIAAFTVGSMGDDISVSDNFLLAARRPIIYAFVAGAVFNLANMLLVAAIDLAGMSVAFPVGIGLALIVGVAWSFLQSQVGNPLYLFGGCALVLIAVVLSAVAHGQMDSIRKKLAAALAAEQAPPAGPDEAPLTPAAARKKRMAEQAASSGPGPFRGVLLAVIGGLLMGSFYPIVQWSMEGDLGLSNPYAVAMVFSFGILVTTFIYNLYFMNLPVKGLPISPFAYFTGNLGQHALGLLGGMIWMVGTVANFAGSAAQGAAKAGPAVSYALGQGAALVSVLWGLLIWKEYAGATGGVTRLIILMLLFFIGGLTLVSIAPLY
jgi:glucose uptake protein